MVMNFGSMGLRCLIAMLAILGTTASKAQTEHNFSVYFETGSELLSKQTIGKIDSVLSLMTNIPAAYGIRILGHTDNVGNEQYNQQLSQKRAYNTAQYFLKKGFSRKKVTSKAYGSKAPMGNNISERGKAINRRVEILVAIEVPKMGTVAGIRLQPDQYKISSTEGGIIEHATGTRIIIPPSAFVDKNGKPVEGEIEIRYRDFREPIDFVLGGFPMNYFKQGHQYNFNSAGMFEILAYQKGMPIYLKRTKRISLDFVVTEDLKDLNFYRFDTVSGRWAELAQLTGERAGGMDPFFKNRRTCISLNGQRLCTIDDCEAKVFLNRIGVLAATSDGSILDYLESIPVPLGDGASWTGGSQRKMIRELQQRIEAFNTQRDSLFQVVNKNDRFYSLESVKLKNRKAIFKVSCSSDRFNEMVPFEESFWHYSFKKNRGPKKYAYQTEWETCNLTQSTKSQTYSLIASGNGTSVHMKNIECKPSKKRRKNTGMASAQELFNSYDSIRKATNHILQKADSLHEIVGLHEDSIASLREDLYEMKRNWSILRMDSAHCFWQLSQPYMTKEEQVLDRPDWFFYFDKHKPSMRERYKAIEEEPEYDRCKAQILQRAQLRRKLIEARAKVDSVKQSANTLFQDPGSPLVKTLSIGNMGIYNCDQIIKETNTIVLRAKYRDENGKEVLPLIVYLIDDSRNGIVTYDGYLGYSPYRFKYNPASRNTLVAMDEELNAYIIKNDEFAKAKAVIKGKSAKYTFTVKSIPRQKTKESLKAVL